ncbi:MAG: DUF742 domain-containing protein [Actinomycetota bacterium]
MTDDHSDDLDTTSPEANPVRPYVITGGRTRSSSDDLPIETVVETTASTDAEQLGFERRSIAEHCRRPQSIAELAGLLDLPLGVARVLVTDMTAEGLLFAHEVVDPSDPAYIERLREGIRAL